MGRHIYKKTLRFQHAVKSITSPQCDVTAKEINAILRVFMIYYPERDISQTTFGLLEATT